MPSSEFFFISKHVGAQFIDRFSLSTLSAIYV